jgi:hypothetical protein
MVTELSTSRQPAQMVWGCIWLDEWGRPRRSDLGIMAHDNDAPKGRYSAQRYIETLRKSLLPHYLSRQPTLAWFGSLSYTIFLASWPILR